MIHKQTFNLAFFLLFAVTISTRVAAEDCCEPGDTKPDEDDCSKYFVCCTGQFKPMSCPQGEYWNVKAEKCLKDDGQCVTTPSTPTPSTPTPSTPTPSTPTPSTPTPSTPTPTTVCQSTPSIPTCSEGDVKENSSNCAGFYKCVNGKYVAQVCESGNYWNVKAKKCEKDEGHCVTTPSTPTPSTPTPSTPTPSTPTPSTPTPSTPTPTTVCQSTPSIPTCSEGDVKENSSNCAGFYKCVNGKYVAQVCESGNYWNVKAKKLCQSTPNPPTCVEGDVKENPSNCAGFYKCVNGKYVAQVSTPCQSTPNPPTCVEGDVKENPSNCSGFYNPINPYPIDPYPINPYPIDTYPIIPYPINTHPINLC
ncbi:mucin-2 [Drosophila innubila]|uniref:mucin-2 n=1 Tax=Drosophila innubila TaxID=198719 RepID=UPI00148C60C8|nr:mucin-2 [Drosophila innubila]